MEEQKAVLITSAEIGEIAPAFVKFQSLVQNPKNGNTNPHYKSKYADLAEILSTVRKPLTDCGLALMQVANVIEDVNQKTGAINTIVRIETHLFHASAQFFRYSLDMIPMKNDPQGIGSAMTYGKRYSITGMLGVAGEGEDDDGNGASEKPGDDQRPQQALTGAEVIKVLNGFYNDPKATKQAVLAYLKPREKFIEKLSEAERAQVRAAYDQCNERFKAPSAAENTKTEGSSSVEKAGYIVKLLGDAKSISAVTDIMNGSYYPVKDRMELPHQKIVEQAAEGVIKKLGGI